MRAVIQRVKKAIVTINDQVYSNINSGLLVFLGIEYYDNKEDADWLANKIVNLRIFPDSNDVMNLDVLTINGNIMIVSQFTLHAKTKKGNRPCYARAANPDISYPLYNYFINKVELLTNKKPATGKFGEMMQIELINDGPVTIIIDTKNKE
ncbi:MAG: D-aminoacyl-tRNA deacylase [Marinilabiliales bacterium]